MCVCVKERVGHVMRAEVEFCGGVGGGKYG